MGTGDLNLLKSWNPHLLKNKKKVWEIEQQALEENRKLQERQHEIEKQRQLDELTSLTRDGKVREKKSNLDWMYNDQPAVDHAKDEFLLGKKRIENSTLLGRPTEDTKEDQKNRRRFKSSSNPSVHTMLRKEDQKPRHDLSKEDPLASFQKAKTMRKVSQANKVQKPSFRSKTGTLPPKYDTTKKTPKKSDLDY
ncbi:LADA_0H03070g1_1 [Lachancea dasiensis]|uniref:Pre-mRNA-splicing factor CWC25 n=1 Tax=Lachancea dasiensis TaxID=1072105 RepID=A0A1G4K046_9SACH|nr:LADA_0H03070g1_1 [Lachancea dasiensis]